MQLKAIWQENSPYSKILITVGTILVMTTLFTVVGSALAAAIYGLSVEQLPALIKDLSNPDAIAVMKIIQAASTLGVFIAPALFLALVFSPAPSAYLQLNKRYTTGSGFRVMAMMIFAVPLINALVTLNNGMVLPDFLKGLETAMREAEDRAAIITEAFMDMHNPVDLLINLLVIAVLPAVGEELLFRGILQKLLGQWSKNIHVGIWISAFVFSAMHAQFYGFVPRMLLGAFFGYLLVWSGSLWLPILAHFINNGSAVLFTYLFGSGVITTNPDKLGTTLLDTWWVLISGVICATLIFQLYRSRINSNESLSN